MQDPRNRRTKNALGCVLYLGVRWHGPKKHTATFMMFVVDIETEEIEVVRFVECDVADHCYRLRRLNMYTCA